MESIIDMLNSENRDQLQPRLLIFFNVEQREFEQYVQGALGELLKKSVREKNSLGRWSNCT